MSSPERKRKKKPWLKQSPVLGSTPESTPNPSLPDDLVVSCLARVSRLHYPALSLVSKSFRSLLASQELYKTRSSLGHTESCVYVCLEFHPDPIPRWFTLCRKPDQTLTTNVTMKLKKMKKPSGYVLAKLTTPHSRPGCRQGLVTLGSDIYNIGGPIDDDNEPSSSVSILDCRTHTWREGPSMHLKRKSPVASVLDGKIYVADSSCSDWIEVFDPKTQTWDLVSIPGTVIPVLHGIRTSAGIAGKVYFLGIRNGLAYETREGRWESVGWGMNMAWVCYSYCVIENVLYYYHLGKFLWYDSTTRLWRFLKGVKDLSKFPSYCARLVDYGGKMAVFWDRDVASSRYKDKVIMCAVIALERRSNGDIWGKVEWQGTVLTVPKSCQIKYALAAIL